MRKTFLTEGFESIFKELKEDVDGEIEIEDEDEVEDTIKHEKKLINEAPDAYGLPTDDELEAEKKKRLADLEKEFNDKKQNIHTQRTQFDNEEIKIKNLIQEFYNKVDKKIQQFVEDIKQGKYLEFYSYIRNDDIKEVGFKEGKMSFKFNDNYIVAYDVKTHKIWWSNPRSSVSQKLPLIMNNLDKYLQAIKDQNEQSRINATNNRQLMSLFKNPNLLTSIRKSDNPGHWAHGGRFCVFAYNGKIYSYEDYDSGAYSGNHCHQLREFNQIGLDEDHANSYYDYTCPVIQKIDPAQVGLKVKKDSYGITVDGQIDLTLLDNLKEDIDLNKKVEDVAEDEKTIPDDFEGQMDYLIDDEKEAVKGYKDVEKKVEDNHVKDQLKKIEDEEKDHQKFLKDVKKDPTIEYKAEEENESEDDSKQPEEEAEAPAEDNIEENLNHFIESCVDDYNKMRESLTEASTNICACGHNDSLLGILSKKLFGFMSKSSDKKVQDALLQSTAQTVEEELIDHASNGMVPNYGPYNNVEEAAYAVIAAVRDNQAESVDSATQNVINKIVASW